MPKAFWKGVISFGLVAIPVKMYTGTETKSISFHLLHKKCLTRPKQVLHCEEDNEYFGIKDTMRGFEVAKDQYVVMDEKDFEKVPIKTTHSIDILGFIGGNEIDPIYYSGLHYLEPETVGVKSFHLLKEALIKTGQMGIGKVTFQHKEHLGCIRPLDNILVLHTLHYKTEILPRNEIAAPQTKVTESEFEMAVSLIKAMTKSFKPDDYKDEYREALQKVVEAKENGKKIVAPPAPKREVGDLMTALRASIEAVKKEPVLSK